VNEQNGIHVLTCAQLPEDLERNQLLLTTVPNSLEAIEAHAAAKSLARISFSCPGGAPRRLNIFSQNGYDVRALSLLQWKPSPALTPQHRVRVLTNDDDWNAATTLRFTQRANGMTADAFQDFTRRRMHLYRTACDAGRGEWFGLFRRGALVSTCGIMCPTGDIARFRLVLTHLRHRRRGYASSLVQGAARHIQMTFGAATILIAAERNSSTQQLYERAGFHEIQTAFQVTRTVGAVLG
jgi:GNAT superfamily N-acetyltransferase